MATVSGASIVTTEGTQVRAHPFGNNVALMCPKCDHHPVLLILRRNQLGSDATHFSSCLACGAKVWSTSPVTGTFSRVMIDFK